jgi:putative protease
MAEEVGKVTHYYDKVGVAVVELSAPLSVGEKVTFKRGEVQFTQEVTSMQIEHQQIEKAEAGQAVGVKVDQKIKPGAIVYRGELPPESEEGAEQE